MNFDLVAQDNIRRCAAIIVSKLDHDPPFRVSVVDVTSLTDNRPDTSTDIGSLKENRVSRREKAGAKLLVLGSIVSDNEEKVSSNIYIVELRYSRLSEMRYAHIITKRTLF